MEADDDFYSGTEYAENDSDYADSIDADYEFVDDDVDDSDDLIFRRRQVFFCFSHLLDLYLLET